MEITDVKVIPVDDEKLKAFVSIVFDHCFVVTDIKVIHGPKGLFVSMPSKKRKDGTFKDIAHPLNNQMRQYLEEKVLGVYRQQVATGPGAAPAASTAPAETAPAETAPAETAPAETAPPAPPAEAAAPPAPAAGPVEASSGSSSAEAAPDKEGGEG
jgi:stage V sporulation protein G